MIEYTVMDYEGEPVTIEDGEILDAEPPRSVWSEKREEYLDDTEGEIYWDSEARDWAIEEYDFYGNDVRDYGRAWWDCN